MFDPVVFEAIQQPLLDPEVLEAVQQPTIDPEVLETIQQPTIGPEVLDSIQQPIIDPEVLEAIQQPTIDPKVVEAVQQPIIDPNLLESLESLEDPTIPDLYLTVAALETSELNETEDVSDNLDEFEKDVEAPEEGGIMSTFLNFSALYLLNNKTIVSDDAVKSLKQVLKSEDVQEKSTHLKNVILVVKDESAQIIVIALSFAFKFAYMLHFDNIDSEDLSKGDQEESDEDEENT
jgi:hypothetical protein